MNEGMGKFGWDATCQWENLDVMQSWDATQNKKDKNHEKDLTTLNSKVFKL